MKKVCWFVLLLYVIYVCIAISTFKIIHYNFFYMKNKIAILFLFSTLSLFAQKFNHLNIEAESATKALKYAFAGGLNAPQLGVADFNQDGKQDLFAFDRIGNVPLTFLNGGTANKIDYTFAPEFAKNFPRLREWVVLKDFNADGAMDIFSYSDEPADGIAVWRGFYDKKILKFKRVYFKGLPFNILPFYNNGKPVNLYVSGQDYPDINDVDGDGDLDVLTFENGGGTVDFYKNMSLEEGVGKDSLLFILQDNCWGKFYESGLTKKLDLSISASKCASYAAPPADRDALHAGSTLLSFDKDNDGDMELLLGDISFKNINMAVNGGTKTSAWCNEQDNVFPDAAVPVNINIFPAPFMLDANNDGKKDFLSAPNNVNSSDDIDACWYYENVGTSALPKFEFRKKNFLVDEMFDFGSNTIPTFADVDGDGLLDIVVGVGFAYKINGDVEGSLVLLKNIGTKTNPKFKLIDDNWLNFKQFVNNSYFFAPTFGDIDGDGDKDLFVGDNQGKLFFVENKGGVNSPMSFDKNTILANYEYQTLDAGQNAVPQVVDLNRDGLQDLLLGESYGILYYYQNIGTKTSPKFEPNKKKFPNIDTLGNVIIQEYSNAKGYAVPVIRDFKGKYELFCSDLKGKIAHYNNIDNNLNKSFSLLNADFGQVNEGYYQAIAMEDINNDGVLDLLVGNQRGGLAFYQTNLKINGDVTAENDTFIADEKISIFPNPTSNSATIYFEKNENVNHKIQIINILGQEIVSKISDENLVNFETSAWGKGIYFVSISAGKSKKVLRLIVQ